MPTGPVEPKETERRKQLREDVRKGTNLGHVQAAYGNLGGVAGLSDELAGLFPVIDVLSSGVSADRRNSNIASRSMVGVSSQTALELSSDSLPQFDDGSNLGVTQVSTFDGFDLSDGVAKSVVSEPEVERPSVLDDLDDIQAIDEWAPEEPKRNRSKERYESRRQALQTLKAKRDGTYVEPEAEPEAASADDDSFQALLWEPEEKTDDEYMLDRTVAERNAGPESDGTVVGVDKLNEVRGEQPESLDRYYDLRDEALGLKGNRDDGEEYSIGYEDSGVFQIKGERFGDTSASLEALGQSFGSDGEDLFDYEPGSEFDDGVLDRQEAAGVLKAERDMVRSYAESKGIDPTSIPGLDEPQGQDVDSPPSAVIDIARAGAPKAPPRDDNFVVGRDSLPPGETGMVLESTGETGPSDEPQGEQIEPEEPKRNRSKERYESRRQALQTLKAKRDGTYVEPEAASGDSDSRQVGEADAVRQAQEGTTGSPYAAFNARGGSQSVSRGSQAQANYQAGSGDDFVQAVDESSDATADILDRAAQLLFQHAERLRRIEYTLAEASR